MSSTLRRLSLTVQKRRRIAESKSGAASGGKAKVGKKRPKNEKGGGGVSAGLFDKETGEPIEVWIHGGKKLELLLLSSSSASLLFVVDG